jgi:hypothetical protein
VVIPLDQWKINNLPLKQRVADAMIRTMPELTAVFLSKIYPEGIKKALLLL